MVDHDRLFKELLTTFIGDFLVLFAPKLARTIDLGRIELLDKELLTDVTRGERQVVDVLARVRLRRRGRPSCVLVHVENQARRERDFGDRLFRYYAALTLRFREPAYPIAVFSYPGPGAEPHAHVVRLPGLEVLQFRFHVVQLNRLDWRRYLKKPNPVAAALMAKMHVAPADRPRVKAACLRMLVGLGLDAARQALVAGFVDTYLRLDEHEERMFRQEIATPDEEKVMEIVTSWEERGREEGRREGLEEGRQAEACRFVGALVRRRLGSVAPELEVRLGALPVAVLEELGEAVFDMATLADLERWLASRS